MNKSTSSVIALILGLVWLLLTLVQIPLGATLVAMDSLDEVKLKLAFMGLSSQSSNLPRSDATDRSSDLSGEQIRFSPYNDQLADQHLQKLARSSLTRGGVISVNGHSRDRGKVSMAWLQDTCFSGGLCRYLNVSTASTMPLLINLTFDCRGMFERGKVGSGNYMATMYSVRALAKSSPSPTAVQIYCPDANNEKSALLYPWLTGYFPSSSSTVESKEESDTTLEVCRKRNSRPRYTLVSVLEEIKFDLRRMAITLIGLPSNDLQHPAHTWARDKLWSTTAVQAYNQGHFGFFQIPPPLPNQPPLYPDTPVDDAILHFRCGDLVLIKTKKYGFIKFDTYARPLSNPRSIGIVTQPFEASKNSRAKDGKSNKKCKLLVGALVDYLQQQFPTTKIRVYNDPDETLALTYARMIMAKQVVAGVSSFGLFPGLTTFGTAHLLPQLHLHPDLPSLDSRVEILDKEPFLSCTQQHDLWDQTTNNGEPLILDWFRNVSMPPLSVYQAA